MSRAIGRTAVRRIVLGLALVGLGICATTTANAGDLGPPVYGPAPYPAPPVYGPAPYPAPNYGATYERGGPCHIVLDRRVDPYGREIVHRVRVCDEGAGYPPVEAPVVAPGYGYPPPRYYEPQPSGYYPYAPRPPAPIGPGYYN
jgi:hypothetical protein